MAFQKSIKHIEEMKTMDMRYLMVIMHNCFHSFEVSKNEVFVCVFTGHLLMCALIIQLYKHIIHFRFYCLKYVLMQKLYINNIVKKI